MSAARLSWADVSAGKGGNRRCREPVLARVRAVAGAAMSRRVCAGARGLKQGNAMSYARECDVLCERMRWLCAGHGRISVCLYKKELN